MPGAGLSGVQDTAPRSWRYRGSRAAPEAPARLPRSVALLARSGARRITYEMSTSERRDRVGRHSERNRVPVNRVTLKHSRRFGGPDQMSTSARRAAIEAAVPATKNRAFKSAWWSGVYAFRTGKAITECPYLTCAAAVTATSSPGRGRFAASGRKDTETLRRSDNWGYGAQPVQNDGHVEQRPRGRR